MAAQVSTRLKHPSREEELALFACWRTGDLNALHRLIMCHDGLAWKFALDAHKRNTQVSIDDLVQEGRFGLIQAAYRFDESKGARFATWATYWIRAFMMERIIRDHGPVRIGTTREQRRLFFGLGKARRALIGAGVDPTAEAIAQHMGADVRLVESMIQRFKGHDPSLDESVTEDDERTLHNLFADDHDVEAAIVNDDTQQHRLDLVHEAMALLDKRESKILNARFRTVPATLATLGKKLAVSRERVRQIERGRSGRSSAPCKRCWNVRGRRCPRARTAAQPRSIRGAWARYMRRSETSGT